MTSYHLIALFQTCISFFSVMTPKSCVTKREKTRTEKERENPACAKWRHSHHRPGQRFAPLLELHVGGEELSQLLAVWLPLRTLAASSLAGQGPSKDEHDQLCTAMRNPLPRCGIIDISAVQKRAVCKEIPEVQVDKRIMGEDTHKTAEIPKLQALNTSRSWKLLRLWSLSIQTDQGTLFCEFLKADEAAACAQLALPAMMLIERLGFLSSAGPRGRASWTARARRTAAMPVTRR